MWEFDWPLLQNLTSFNPTWVPVDPSITPDPAPNTPPLSASGRGDDILTDEEANFLEQGILEFVESLVEPVQIYGADQNSYMDEPYNIAPMPFDFMGDFGQYLSASSRDALGFNYFNFLTADVDPEFLTASDVEFVSRSMAQAGASYGSDFQTTVNGFLIRFQYNSAPPTGTSSADLIVVNGGHYSYSIVSTPYVINNNNGYDMHLAANNSGYHTFNTLDWGHPVPLTDSENETMLDINGDVIFRPANINISQIYRLGQSYADTPWTQMGTILQILFGHGGRYDFQRQGGVRHPQDRILMPSGYLFHPEYVSFSTVAIGVFAAGARISMNEILSIQNTFAALRSSFPAGTPMDPVYTNLPARNVANTRLGFILARGN